MTHSSSTRRYSRMGLAAMGAAILAMLSLPASAHVTATSETDQAGAHTVITMSVPHGCDGSATTQVSIQIPDLIESVTPTRHPFYEVETVSQKLDPPVDDGHGGELTSRVSEVIYTATSPLPDNQRDAFELALQLPEEGAQTLYFPAVQTCEDGEAAWIDIPAQGQDPEELTMPAPSIEVVDEQTPAVHHDSLDDDSNDAATDTATLPVIALTAATAALIIAIFGLVIKRR